MIGLDLIGLDLIGLELIELELIDLADQDKACGRSDTQLTLTEVLDEDWLRDSSSEWWLANNGCWQCRMDAHDE